MGIENYVILVGQSGRFWGWQIGGFDVWLFLMWTCGGERFWHVGKSNESATKQARVKMPCVLDIYKYIFIYLFKKLKDMDSNFAWWGKS